MIYDMHLLVLGTVQDTMMLGADYYETDEERAALIAAGKVPMGIGENTKIRYTTHLQFRNVHYELMKLPVITRFVLTFSSQTSDMV
jgi:hypothetical protein